MNNKKTIILLSGLKGSGKDTFAAMLQEVIVEADQPAPQIEAWANALKVATTKLLNLIYGPTGPNGPTGPFTVEMMSDRTVREGPFPGPEMLWGGKQICLRTVLQTFGTEVCRDNINSSVWIDALLNKIRDNNITIITDCRFSNEILEVQKTKAATHQIFVVKINKPGLVSDGHASEAGIRTDLITHQIDNSGDLDKLRENARQFLDQNVFDTK